MISKLKSASKLFLENSYCFAILLLTLLVITYWQLIVNDPILNYDDSILLYSLSKINSLPHYFHSIANGLILDIQPIRDLSFYLDFNLKSLLPFYSFHLSNLIIWFLICFNVRSIFKIQFPKYQYVVGIIVLIYALSPISANSVAWISARKHLLSTLFITYSTWLVLKNRDNLNGSKAFLICLSYLLSCSSQPINSLWVLWLFYWLVSNKKLKENLSLVIGSIIVSSTSVLINLYYYKIIYAQKISTTSKFVNIKTLDFGDPLLAIGRYFYQCLNVFSALPTSHYQGSWENLLGLLLLVLFLAFCFKKIRQGNNRLLSPVIYFFFPLIIVTANMTNIFCSDTYLLNSSIGFYWAVLILFDELSFKRILIPLLGIYLIAAATYNFNYVNIFLNENDLWLYSQNKEATSQTTIIASSIYIKQKKFKESYLLIEELQQRWPNQLFLSQVIAENLFYNQAIPSDVKISKMLEISPKMPSTYLYLSILYGYAGNKAELEKIIFKIFEDPTRFNMEFRGSEEKISAVFLYTCDYYKLENCDKYLKEFKENAIRKEWNDSEIDEFLQILKKSEKYQINL